MLNYRFQKAILVARKVASFGVILTAPVLTKLASDYATLVRGCFRSMRESHIRAICRISAWNMQ